MCSVSVRCIWLDPGYARETESPVAAQTLILTLIFEITISSRIANYLHHPLSSRLLVRWSSRRHQGEGGRSLRHHLHQGSMTFLTGKKINENLKTRWTSVDPSWICIDPFSSNIENWAYFPNFCKNFPQISCKKAMKTSEPFSGNIGKSAVFKNPALVTFSFNQYLTSFRNAEKSLRAIIKKNT